MMVKQTISQCRGKSNTTTFSSRNAELMIKISQPVKHQINPMDIIILQKDKDGSKFLAVFSTVVPKIVDSVNLRSGCTFCAA